MMKQSYIDECLERANAASPGKWEFTDNCGASWNDWRYYRYLESDNANIIESDDFSFSIKKQDAEFISHARTDVVELAKRLQKACKYIRASGCHVDLAIADELEAPFPEIDNLCACGNKATHQCNFVSNEVCTTWLCDGCKHEHKAAP